MEENQERRKRQKQEKGSKNDTDEVHNEGSHEGIDVKKKGKEKQSESKGEGMKCLQKGTNWECGHQRAPGWNYCVFHINIAAEDAGRLAKTMTLKQASANVDNVLKELASLKLPAYTVEEEESAAKELSNWARLKEPGTLVEKSVGQALVELSEVKVPGAEEVIEAENRAAALSKKAEEKKKKFYYLKLREQLSIAKAVASTAKPSEAVNLEEQVEAALKAIEESETAEEGLFHG